MTDWFCVIVIVIVTTGASCLGELLKINNSLQELNMRLNIIGNDGMSSVADGLWYNKSLTMLDVQWCRLSMKGTVVYKTVFIIIWSLQFSCSYSVFVQITFYIEAITGRMQVLLWVMCAFVLSNPLLCLCRMYVFICRS